MDKLVPRREVPLWREERDKTYLQGQVYDLEEDVWDIQDKLTNRVKLSYQLSYTRNMYLVS